MLPIIHFISTVRLLACLLAWPVSVMMCADGRSFICFFFLLACLLVPMHWHACNLRYLARTATPPSAAAVLNFSCVENYGSNCSYGFKASRYGGYVFYPRSDEKKAERGNISALVMCNSTSLHAAPIFVNALANAQARTVLANKTFFSSTAASSASRLPSITVSSWPFPDTKTEEVRRLLVCFRFVTCTLSIRREKVLLYHLLVWLNRELCTFFLPALVYRTLAQGCLLSEWR